MKVLVGLAAVLRTALGMRDGGAREFAGSERTTSRVPLPDRARLAAQGEFLRRTEKHRDQPLSLLVVQLSELREFDELFGNAAVEVAAGRVMSALMRVAGTQGLPVRTEPDTFALLMPGYGAQELMELFERKLGRAYSVEFERSGTEVFLLPDVLARRVRSDETVASAYDTLCNDIAQTRSCQRRRQTYLRKERESHTRPAPLLHVAPVNNPGTLAAEIPPTVRLDLR